MQSIEALSAECVAKLRGLLFDLDDTFLEHSQLVPEALAALYALKRAGFELLAVTGRPSGWGGAIAQQWPIDAAVAENGAIAVVRSGARVVLDDPLEPLARARRRDALLAVVERLRALHPELAPTDDVWQRVSDFTFDIGEHRRVEPAVVARARQSARALGAFTIASSVHLHVTLDGADKASGALRVLAKLHGLDPAVSLVRYAFIGDSENDAACFAAFRATIAVKNLSGHPTLLPAFQTRAPRAEGFVEAAELLLARKAELW